VLNLHSIHYSLHKLFEESELNKKISLIATIVLVLALCMLAGPALATKPSPSMLYAFGTGYAYVKNGMKWGPATLYINTDLLVACYDSHSDLYHNVIALAFPVWNPYNGWTFLWKITTTSVLPNGAIMLYAVPLHINSYGQPLYNCYTPGLFPINVVLLPPSTASGSMNGQQWVTLSGMGAGFNGWTCSALFWD
jgi:hypothetical protein